MSEPLLKKTFVINELSPPFAPPSAQTEQNSACLANRTAKAHGFGSILVIIGIIGDPIIYPTALERIKLNFHLG